MDMNGQQSFYFGAATGAQDFDSDGSDFVLSEEESFYKSDDNEFDSISIGSNNEEVLEQ